MSAKPEQPKARWDDYVNDMADTEVQDTSGSSKTRVQYYRENFSSYDNDMQICFKYTGPTVAANAIHECLQGDVSKSVLDIAGGSGLVVEKLRKLGNYTNVDVVDPAAEFVEVAVSKGYYNKVYSMYFYYGCGMEENSYDVVCVCGGMLPGHLKAESIREMCKVIKPSGFTVIMMKQSYLTEHEDLMNVRPTIEALVSEKKCQVIKDIQVEGYFIGTPGHLFVFKKL